MNVLLIDDDEDTTFLMDVLFRKSGIVDSYYIENNGKSALDRLKSYGLNADCIFVDLQMPDMNGFEFVEKYEELFKNKNKNTQVFFLSNSALQSDHSKAQTYTSVSEFIPKPLNKLKLLDIKNKLNTKEVLQ